MESVKAFINNKIAILLTILGSYITPAQAVQLEEIVVTSQKRAEGIQEVPISVSALDSEDLQALNIASLKDVALVSPGLTFNSTFSIAQPFIRGIGQNVPTPGLEPPVATYVDEFYSPRSFMGVLELVDVSGVEVLRGPQGTLYGRNATGGALLVKTADPVIDEFSGNVEARYGRFDEERFDGVINIPVADRLAVRLAGRYSARDGYVENKYTGEDWQDYDDWQFRAKVKWLPLDNLEVVLTAERAETKNHKSANQLAVQNDAAAGEFPCLPCLAAGIPEADQHLGFYETLQGFYVETEGEQDLATLRVTLDLDDYTVTSVTGYREMRILTGTDQSGAAGYNALNLFRSDIDLGGEDYSQELRLSSNYDGRFNFITGFNLWKNTDPIVFDLDGVLAQDIFGNFGSPTETLEHVPPAVLLATFNEAESEAWSVYGEIYLDLTERVSLVVGGRYNEDIKDVMGYLPFPGTGYVAVPGTTFSASKKFTKFTPRITLQYAGDTGNYYLTYNEAFKSGGFDTPAFGQGAAVEPEEIASLEFGAKNEFLDGALRTTFAAFYYFYDDIQVAIVDPATTLSSKQNAEGADNYGFELDVAWAVSEHLTMSVGGAFQNAEFKDYSNASVVVVNPAFATPGVDPYLIGGSADASGTQLPYAPDYTGYLSATYERPIADGLMGKITGVYNYSDEYLFTPLAGGDLGVDKQDSYGILNLTAEIASPGQGWTLGIYGANITDEEYLGNSGGSAVAFNQAAAPPATYGVYLRYKFNRDAN